MATQIKVPDIGDFSDVDVIEVHIKAGDTVAVDDPLITLETDKASMDVPATEAGTVKDVAIKVGDKVSQGSLVCTLEGAGGVGEAPKPAEAPAAAPSAPAGGGAAQEIAVPDIGDFSGVDVIEVHVKAGDTLAVDDPLITLETDKASMDVPAPAAGTVKAVSVKVGDKVSQGTPILTLEGAGGAAAPAAAPEKPVPAAAPAAPAPAAGPERRPPPAGELEAVDEAAFATVHASPSVRRLAREMGVNLGRVQGTGRKGRITREDVQGYVKRALSGEPAAAKPAAAAPAGGTGIPPIPAVDFSKFGEIDTQPLKRIKKLTGANLSRAWLNIPHVTYHDEVDITEMEAFRVSLKAEAEKRGVRVTALNFLMKALVPVLKAFPQFNASLSADGESLVYKKYFHVGVAVDTPNGLVVPVFRDVDQKGLFELAAEIGEVSKRARDGKLKPNEMQGACITISSLGGIGGSAFTPIVNAPEVAILGVTRSQMKPVWNGKEFVPRLMQPLDLSFDHRVIDGAEAARFVTAYGGILTDLRRLLL